MNKSDYKANIKGNKFNEGFAALPQLFSAV